MSSTLFTQSSTRFLTAIKLINDMNADGLPKILARIFDRLLEDRQTLFSESEELDLTNIFSIELSQLKMISDALTYIFETAVYHTVDPENLKSALEKLGLGTDHIQVLVKSWTENGPNLVSSLKKKSFGAPNVLEDVSWRMHAEMSNSKECEKSEIRSIFSLKLSTPATARDSAKSENLIVDLSKNDVERLYNDLEVIQKQLDSLS
eukprot:106229_1